MKDLAYWIPLLVSMDRRRARACCPGVSLSRAHQIVPGALVAEACMDIFGLDELEICPWALREGVILERIDKIGLVESAVTGGLDGLTCRPPSPSRPPRSTPSRPRTPSRTPPSSATTPWR